MKEAIINRGEMANGIRLVHQQVIAEVGHCGIMIHAGSRDEKKNEHGLAHFIEHSLFKGTPKRKSYHVLTRIDSVGGELNAYTTKEETCIYASFPAQYGERSLELIADITFNATFPPEEIKKEKDVICDEIQSYNDSPSEQIFDDFEELLFPNHALGRPILGTEKSVRAFHRDHILSFKKETWISSAVVVSYVGPDSFEKFKNWCDKHLSENKLPARGRKRKGVITSGKFHKEEVRNTYQAHRIIGGIAPSSMEKDRTAMILLNNLLGGPYMNSRLNLKIREKYGFTYNLESGYNTFTDTGVFTIYMGTEKATLEKTHQLVLKELKQLREKKLSLSQIRQAQKQLLGNLMLGRDNNSAVMMGLAKSVLLFDTIDNMERIKKEIEKITPSQLMAMANRVFKEKNLQSLTYLP
jgi:predicted Zn-dependent peptidase